MAIAEPEALRRGVCPVCGSVLSAFWEGPCAGHRCAGCGWSVVTTNPHHPAFDKTAYDIWLVPDMVERKSAIAAIALLIGMDIRSARQIYDSGDPLERGVNALRVLDLHRDLKTRGMSLRVEPTPTWDLEGSSA